jgi:squalene-hopene/tetraprenyl-beta-curcumene cyclase
MQRGRCVHLRDVAVDLFDVYGFFPVVIPEPKRQDLSMNSTRLPSACPVVALLLVSIVTAAMRSETIAANETSPALRHAAVERGLRFLREQGQAEDGTFSAKAGPGLTALAITAALRNGLTVDDQMVAKGLRALEGFVKPDGGILAKATRACTIIIMPLPRR